MYPDCWDVLYELQWTQPALYELIQRDVYVWWQTGTFNGEPLSWEDVLTIMEFVLAEAGYPCVFDNPT